VILALFMLFFSAAKNLDYETDRLDYEVFVACKSKGKYTRSAAEAQIRTSCHCFWLLGY
jgi:hypothetical protein